MGYYPFSVGDRVEVINSKYRLVKAGAKGPIKSIYSNNIRVNIDDVRNPCSSYGSFYFTAQQLKLNFERGIIMTGHYRVAEIRFIEGSNTKETYRYACYDNDLQVGDTCVVKSAHHGFGIARIVAFDALKPEEVISREIVCHADFRAYEKRVADRERAAELKRLMEARAKKLQDVALYKMLAADDTEMAALLGEFEQLTGGESK